MDDVPIRDVADTAFMVATYRAMETERPDALFRDPLADALAGDHGRTIVAGLPRRAFIGQWFVAIRTCIIDDFIRGALAEGVDTIVNLGAGLDTRPYRMDLPGSLDWIEVDCARIIALKEARLRGESPHCRLARIACDLADAAQRRQLLSEIAGKSHKALVLTEGVIPYLTAQEVGALADDLRALPAFQYWIVDYLSPRTRRYRKRTEKKMKMQNAPFQFDPDDYFGFVAEHGWRAQEINYVADAADRLGRPVPLPFVLRLWIKLKALLALGKGRDDMRKSVAYVLLVPAA